MRFEIEKRDRDEELQQEFDPALINQILTEVLGDDYMNDSKDELFLVTNEEVSRSRRSSISIQGDTLSVSSSGKPYKGVNNTNRNQRGIVGEEQENDYSEGNDYENENDENDDANNILNVETILRMIDRNESVQAAAAASAGFNKNSAGDDGSESGASSSSYLNQSTSIHRIQQGQEYNSSEQLDALDTIEKEEMMDLESLPADVAAADKEYPLIFDSIHEKNFIHGDNINFYLHSLVSRFNAKHPDFTFTCLKVHFENQYIERVCLGGEDGSIVVLEGNYLQQQKESYSVFKLTQQATRSVVCLDISYNGNMLVSGFSDGAVGFWDISKKSCVKLTTNLFESPVLQAKFLTADSVLLTDNKGNVSLSKLKKNLLAYNVENKMLISASSFSFFQIKLRRSMLTLAAPHSNQQQQQPNGIPTSAGATTTPCLLAALVAIDFIIIIMLEPYIAHVARIENDSSQKIPYFAWTPYNAAVNAAAAASATVGKGAPVDFAIGTGSLMKVFRLRNLFEETTQNLSHELPEFLSFFQSAKEMMYTEFLTENLLFYIDANNLLTIVTLHRFKPASTFTALPLNLLDTKYVLKPEEDAECIVLRELVKADINFHIFVKTENDLIKSCHANSISVHNNTIYLLGSKQLVNGRLEQWDAYINKLIEKSDWIQALYKLIRIYRGDDLLYAGISSVKSTRKSQMQKLIQSMSRRYLEEVASILKEQNSEELWIMRLWTLTEFLVSLEDFEFIFTELLQLIGQFGALPIFMRILQPFILRKSIKSIPASSLRRVLDSIVKSEDKGKLHLAKKLIVQLDYDSIDVDSTIRVCCEFKLFSALAYLYPRNNADFKTLAFQMYAHYLQSSRTDTRTAHLCLWYIRHSLRGYLYPKLPMNHQTHSQAVTQLACWLFVEETLKELIKVDCWLVFEIILLFFQQPASKFLVEHNDNLYTSISIDNKLCSVKEAAALQSSLLEAIPSVHSLIISLVERSINTIDIDEITCFYSFVLEVAFLGFDISVAHVYSCAEFFFANPDFGDSKRNAAPTTTTQTALTITQKLHRSQQTLESKSERLIKMLSVHTAEMQRLPPGVVDVVGITNNNSNNNNNSTNVSTANAVKSESMMSLLIGKATYSPFVEVTAYLQYSIQNYKACIDLYVGARSKHINVKVFTFLEQIFNEISREESNELMQYIFATKLKDLVAFDSEKTRVFIETHRTAGDEADQAIEKLSAFPDLQYKLLDKIMKNKRARAAASGNTNDASAAIPHRLLVLHLELLATYQPQFVIKELRAYDYPLDESLIITKEKGILDATAYLYERTGDINQAITLYIEVFKAKLAQLIGPAQLQRQASNEKAGNSNGTTLTEAKLQSSLSGYLRPCIEICITHNKKGDQESENNWFMVIDKIMEIQRRCVKEGVLEKRMVVSFFSALINEVVETMLHHVRFDCFIENLLDILQVYTLKDMKSTFQRLLHELCFEQQVLSNSIHILEQNCHAQHLKILSFYQKGYKIQNTCCVCDSKIDNLSELSSEKSEDLIIFNCKHTSHRKCVVGQTYCPICINDPQFLWIQAIYKLKTYKGLHDSSHNLDASESGNNNSSNHDFDEESNSNSSIGSGNDRLKNSISRKKIFEKLTSFDTSKFEAKQKRLDHLGESQGSDSQQFFLNDKR